MKFQLDTGAMWNVMLHTTLKETGIHHKHRSTRNTLKSYSGHRIIPKGVTTLNDRVLNIELLVVDINAKTIVGAKACAMLNLIQRMSVNRVKQEHSDKTLTTESAVNKNIPNDVQKKYGDVFKCLGCLPGEHTIRIDPNV